VTWLISCGNSIATNCLCLSNAFCHVLIEYWFIDWLNQFVRFLASIQHRFFGRRFVNRSPYAIGPLSCPVLCVCLSVCDVNVLWPNGCTDQDVTWHAGRPRPRPHYVRWRPRSPQKERGHSPQFLAPNFRPMTVGAKSGDWLILTISNLQTSEIYWS